eukprot:432666-Pyramimonas_sp.AAC.1
MCGTHAGGPSGGRRWGSLWGHYILYWVCGTHADGSSGTFGGVPYAATKRCTGCAGRMRTV